MFVDLIGLSARYRQLKLQWLAFVPLAVLAATGCANWSHGGEPAFETKLNASVGRSFYSTDWSRPTGAQVREIEISETQRGVEYRWLNGCVFVILIDAQTNIITGWSFTQGEAECRSVRGHAFGT